MDQSIISHAMIREKARAAFARGVGRDGHGFNLFCTAVISTWQHEWDLCMQEWYAAQQQTEAAAA